MTRYLLTALLLLPGTAFAQAERVTDINSTHTGPAAYFSFLDIEQYLHEVVAFGSRVAFTADDGIHGVELWITDGSPAGTTRVADLCPGRCPSFPRALAVLEDRLFFVADDGVHGSEPFLTDGTEAGTVALADIWPGHGSSRIRSALASSTQVFFVADSPGLGWELWRSDGTAEGTRLVLDLRPGLESSRPFLLGAVGGTAVLSATTDGNEFTLWRSDGTASGTTLISQDFVGVEDNSNVRPVMAGGLVFFESLGPQVVRSDGTAAGTFPVISFPPGSSSPLQLMSWNGRAYFLRSSGSTPFQLWTSDGTVTGTSIVATLPAGLSARELIAGGNGVYFRGCDDEGCELWYSDGTALGTRRTKDIGPGLASGLEVLQPLLAAAGGGLLFYANDGGHGNEIWFSDGSEAGTRIVLDATPGPGSSHGQWDAIRGLTRATVGNRAFFWASSPGSGFELWSSDGSGAGTALTREVNATTSSLLRPPPDTAYSAQPPVAVPDGLLIFASDHGIDDLGAPPGATGREPWFVPHASGPAVSLGDLVPGPAWEQSTLPVAIPGGAVFSVDLRLWRTDGSPGGTVPVAVAAGMDVANFVALGSSLLVTSTDGTGSWEVRPLSLDLAQFGAPVLTYPRNHQLFQLHPVGARAFLAGPDLRVTDGTPAGTRTLSADLGGGATGQFVALSSERTLFSAWTLEHGAEPWRFDATDEAPSLVADIFPGTEPGLFPGHPRLSSWFFPPFAPIGNQALFGADDGIHGFELWATDGTAPGTRLVRDLRPGTISSDLERVTAVGNRAFFVADDGVHGREIWLSDGTAAGTRLLRDLAPGPGSAVPQELTAIGDFLVFNAWTPEHGRELWISDGTEVGTRRLTDVAPGPLSSSPVTFVAAGGWLYFTANDNVTGDELWRLPLSLLQPAVIFVDGFESADVSAWSSL
ncbi:MAG: hypothetical protein SF066_19170 [Thermoanaerobaculia bacterium]|nr:hypothetical protein [Thermoanaerobaculia bacterium]